MDTEIIVKDNSAAVTAAFEAAIVVALEKVGLVAEGNAKAICPVDTGNLRNSITHAVDGNDVYIGTNVEYAKYTEFGTSKMKAQPYLRPAASEHTDTYTGIIKSTLKNA